MFSNNTKAFFIPGFGDYVQDGKSISGVWENAQNSFELGELNFVQLHQTSDDYYVILDIDSQADVLSRELSQYTKYSLVCHSFGCLVLARLIEKYPDVLSCIKEVTLLAPACNDKLFKKRNEDIRSGERRIVCGKDVYVYKSVATTDEFTMSIDNIDPLGLLKSLAINLDDRFSLIYDPLDEITNGVGGIGAPDNRIVRMRGSGHRLDGLQLSHIVTNLEISQV